MMSHSQKVEEDNLSGLSQFELNSFLPATQMPSTSGMQPVRGTAGNVVAVSESSGSAGENSSAPPLLPISSVGVEGVGESVSVCSDGPTSSMNDAMNCVICMDVMESPYITKCGHSYCYSCINRYISTRGKCPKCNANVQSTDILPNHTLAEIISVCKQAERENKHNLTSMLANLNDLFGHDDEGVSKRMKLNEVKSALQVLVGIKNNLESTQRTEQLSLVKDILQRKLQLLSAEFEELRLKFNLMKEDVRYLSGEMTGVGDVSSYNATTPEDGGSQYACQNQQRRDIMFRHYDELIGEYFKMRMDDVTRRRGGTGDSGSVLPGQQSRSAITASQAAAAHSVAAAEPMEPPQSPPEAALGNTPSKQQDARDALLRESDAATPSTRMPAGLERFTECVEKMSKYLYAKDIATVSYKQRMFAHTSHIVSSIDFSNDQNYFAVAGVTKKIKIFDYGIVSCGLHEYHVPNAELTNSSKLSCILFSRFFSNWLVSGDYEGHVILWDLTSNSKTTTFQDHQRRCWSVDINQLEPRLMISGGDDGRVVLYHVQQAKNVGKLDYKANVCCVQFNPSSQYEFIFGTADHCIHYHDIRSLKNPIATLKEHSKAVSYVKFMDSKHVMSASTDSQLRLWDLEGLKCERAFQGHCNEKNFVGLTCTEDYAACGSEDNSVYLYYKGFSKAIINHPITNPPRSFFEVAPKTEAGDFISAVCWKENSDVILAGNSTGTVKIFELVTTA